MDPSRYSALEPHQEGVVEVVTGGSGRSRNAQQTRQRIFDIALQEFASKGFAGARVEAIAERAEVSVRMLYHYFGNKEDLFHEILRTKFRERTVALEGPLGALAGTTTMAEIFPHFHAVLADDPDWIRLIQWESLRDRHQDVLLSEERRRGYGEEVDLLRDHQSAGRLPGDLDPDLLLMAMIALATFPRAFPQLAQLIAGEDPEGTAFEDRYRRFLTALGGHLDRMA